MKLKHPEGRNAVVETTPDLAGPYLRQGWIEDGPITRTRNGRARSAGDGTQSGDAESDSAPTTDKENDNG